MAVVLETFVNGKTLSDPSVPNTTLVGAMDAVTTTIVYASVANLPSSGQFRVLVNDELMLNTTLVGTTGTVTRGVESTTAAAHADASSVFQPLTQGGMARAPGPLTTAGDITYLDANGAPARLAIGSSTNVLKVSAGLPSWGAAATGDVVGPSSSVDNTLVRFDGTTGKLIQDYTSGAPTGSDTGGITIPTTLTLGTSGILSGGTNLIEQSNGTNAQKFRLGNTITTPSTAGEWFKLDWQTTANQIRLGAAKGSSSGTARVMSLDYGGTEASPVAAITVPITSGDITFGGGVALPNGSDSAPSLHFSSDSSTGWYRNASNQWTWLANGGNKISLIDGFARLGSTMSIVWSNGDSTNSADTGLSRISAGVVGVGTGAQGSTAGTIRSSYQSSDGSAGVTAGPFTAVTAITVKNGIVTAITGT